MFTHRFRGQNTQFRKFKVADGRHFENVFIAISKPAGCHRSNELVVVVVVLSSR